MGSKINPRQSTTPDETTDAEHLRALLSIAGRMNGFLYRCRNDADYTMLYMTDGVLGLAGYPAADFIGNRSRSYASILLPEDAPAVDAAVGKALEAGAKWRGYHQDDSYCHWIVTAGYITCWMPLDGTQAAGGTIEYARGSHLWPLSPPMGQFHARVDYEASLRGQVQTGIGIKLV